MFRPTLTIKVEYPKIELELQGEKSEVIDVQEWEENNDLSGTLLAGIDKLLTRNKIEVSHLAKIDVKTQQVRYTSSRISKAVAQTVNYCLGLDRE
ncbi:MAG: hypothetical protein U9O20_03525 [Patescibacteria group bacterium]|nr:hypothetical protein [Patescibacteria group bacterium]